MNNSWSEVLPDDAGIRPAGKQDECFYCHRKVGELHGEQCVMVQQLMEYEVLGAVDEDEPQPVGTYSRREPYCWKPHQCEWHKNESSWCASNAVDSICWNDDAFAQSIREMVESRLCACDILTFHFKRVLEAGPLRGED